MEAGVSACQKRLHDATFFDRLMVAGAVSCNTFFQLCFAKRIMRPHPQGKPAAFRESARGAFLRKAASRTPRRFPYLPANHITSASPWGESAATWARMRSRSSP